MTLVAKKRWIELTILFLVIPVGLILPLPPIQLAVCALMAVFYCLYMLHKAKMFTRTSMLAIPRDTPWRRILIRMGLFIVISTLLVWWFLPEKLFLVVIENPKIWIGVCLFYSIVSVYPQELIYRYFFFWRYQQLLSPNKFLILNAVLFCLAHTMFLNNLVFALTLTGGFLFAQTFRKTNSLMVVALEHAFYGLWLYTVGLGDMLAFPTGLDDMSGPPGPLPLLHEKLIP